MSFLALLTLSTALLLGVMASALALVFRRRELPLLHESGGTLRLLRNPARYVREPYARIVRVMHVLALALFVASFFL